MGGHIQVINDSGETVFWANRKTAWALVTSGKARRFGANRLSLIPQPRTTTYDFGHGQGSDRLVVGESKRLRENRIASAVGFHTEEQWMERVRFFGWKCRYCGILLTVSTLTKDHVIPIALRAIEWASNLVPACRSCNSWKRDRMVRSLS